MDSIVGREGEVGSVKVRVSERLREEETREAGRFHAVTSSCLQLSAAHGACMCPSHGPACCRKPQPCSRERQM